MGPLQPISQILAIVSQCTTDILQSALVAHRQTLKIREVDIGDVRQSIQETNIKGCDFDLDTISTIYQPRRQRLTIMVGSGGSVIPSSRTFLLNVSIISLTIWRSKSSLAFMMDSTKPNWGPCFLANVQ